jgi:hypothetical protein
MSQPGKVCDKNIIGKDAETRQKLTKRARK